MFGPSGRTELVRRQSMVETEVRAYLAEPHELQSGCPLRYWAARETVWPGLSSAAQALLSCPPHKRSERAGIFSCGRHCLRAALPPETQDGRGADLPQGQLLRLSSNPELQGSMRCARCLCLHPLLVRGWKDGETLSQNLKHREFKVDAVPQISPKHLNLDSSANNASHIKSPLKLHD